MVCVVLTVQFAAVSSARPCTAWAVAGYRASHGGTLLAKNRDWKPERDELKLVVPARGFRYLALFALHSNGRRFVAAGINERGLAVISTSASSVPRKERAVGAGGLNEKLLASFDSVESVMQQKGMLSGGHPIFLMLADNSEIAQIEIAPHGAVASKTVNRGALCHTNHYLDPKLLWANHKIGKSSAKRLERIEQLLTGHHCPLTLNDFISFSGDRHDGPDDSIWRTGSSPGKERTLATWIVSIPVKGVPSLYVKLANPGETEKSYRLELDESLWTHGWGDGGTIGTPKVPHSHL